MICSEPLSPTTVAARTVTLVNLNFAYRASPTKTGHWGRQGGGGIHSMGLFSNGMVKIAICLEKKTK